MCGVIGYSPVDEGHRSTRLKTLRSLIFESRVRGIHAFGFAQPGVCHKSHDLDRFLESLELFDDGKPLIAHCRYSTSGDWLDHRNNQPIVVGRESLVFNGVISMATKLEFEEQFGVECETENDGEIFLRRRDRLNLISKHGSFAGVWLDGAQLYAARNVRRPLWLCRAYGAEWYASTRDILRRSQFPWEEAEEVSTT